MIVIYLLAVNLITFVLFGIDKAKAKRNKWRIKESTLLIAAAIGGSYGALLGMFFFHHKTRKPKFFLSVPVFAVIYTILIGYISHFF